MSKGKRRKHPISDRVKRVLGLRASSAASPVTRDKPRSTEKRRAINDQE